LNSVEFEHLLDLPEGERLDWKATFPQGLERAAHTEEHKTARGTLLKDLLALANAPGDSVRHLVYGVKDQISTRHVVGVSHQVDDAELRDWIRNAIEPSIKFVYDPFEYDSKQVAVFTLYPTKDRPYVAAEDMGKKFHKGQVWYRDGTQNRVAVGELRQMFTDTGIELEVTFGDLERNSKSTGLDVPAERLAARLALDLETKPNLLALANAVKTE
jgi:predicted HTH transcriptional regulator